MRTQNRVVFIIAAVIFVLSPCLELDADEQRKDDVEAIKALVAKINLAWKSENGAEIMREVLSEKSFVWVAPMPKEPSKALIFDKEKFCYSFDEMLKRSRPKQHEHRIKSINFIGPIAYEIGTLLNVDAEGNIKHHDILNVFAKDETGWKLVLSLPAANIKKALESPDIIIDKP